jgi:hypothetical protein
MSSRERIKASAAATGSETIHTSTGRQGDFEVFEVELFIEVLRVGFRGPQARYGPARHFA